MGCGGSKAVTPVHEADGDETLVITTSESGDKVVANGNSTKVLSADEPDQYSTSVSGQAGGVTTGPPESPAHTAQNQQATPPPPPPPPLTRAPSQFPPIKKASGSSAIAFEIPLDPAESLIQRHPPKRFQRLEDNQMTMDMFQEKLADAEERRNGLLNQRVQSARYRNLRSAGRAKSRSTMRSDDEQIEGGIMEHRRDETELA